MYVHPGEPDNRNCVCSIVLLRNFLILCEFAGCELAACGWTHQPATELLGVNCVEELLHLFGYFWLTKGRVGTFRQHGSSNWLGLRLGFGFCFFRYARKLVVFALFVWILGFTTDLAKWAEDISSKNVFGIPMDCSNCSKWVQMTLFKRRSRSNARGSRCEWMEFAFAKSKYKYFFQKTSVLTQSFSGGRTNGNNFSMDAGAALFERKT